MLGLRLDLKGRIRFFQLSTKIKQQARKDIEFHLARLDLLTL